MACFCSIHRSQEYAVASNANRTQMKPCAPRTVSGAVTRVGSVVMTAATSDAITATPSGAVTVVIRHSRARISASRRVFASLRTSRESRVAGYAASSSFIVRARCGGLRGMVQVSAYTVVTLGRSTPKSDLGGMAKDRFSPDWLPHWASSCRAARVWEWVAPGI